MGAATHLCTAPMSLVRLSVGALVRQSDGIDRVWSYEPLRVVQRQAAGRPPVMGRAGTARAVRPAVLVHRQGVVRFGPLMVRTSADEVDAIVHQND